MTVFSNPSLDDHEGIYFCSAPDSGLMAIVAIHSTALGPAAGGCRAWQYLNEKAALTDVLRLSRGMSFKNAMAGLSLGGGKAVIMKNGDPLSPATMRRFGEFVESLGGRYITAEDVGLSVDLMREVASATNYVAGLPPQSAGAAGGDPSPKTAYGAFVGIQAAVAERLGRDNLAGLTVAVQGVGNVGGHLCRYLHDAGCKLKIADVDNERLQGISNELGAEIISGEHILRTKCDVFAPCALGGILTEASIATLPAQVVAGAANNQLATDGDGQRLLERGILYCPDYVINAGGIINVAYEYDKIGDDAEVMSKIAEIGARLQSIFSAATTRGLPTNVVADQMALKLIGR